MFMQLAPTAADEKKAAEFRNRFEKFGGTPRPLRKLSTPGSTSASADSGDKSCPDLVRELQNQITEVEKARLKDREELVEKMDKQKKEYTKEIDDSKQKNSVVCTSCSNWWAA